MGQANIIGVYLKNDYNLASQIIEEGSAYQIFINTGKKVFFEKDDPNLKKFNLGELFPKAIVA